MSGADATLKPRELPDPDERGRVYEAMRAHTSAETAGESSDAAGDNRSTTSRPTRPGSETTGARCRALWRCGQTTRHAGRPTDGPQRIRPWTHQHRSTGTANSGSAQNGKRKRPRRSARSARPSRDSPRTRKPSSRRRTPTAAGWSASSTASSARTVFCDEAISAPVATAHSQASATCSIPTRTASARRFEPEDGQPRRGTVRKPRPRDVLLQELRTNPEYKGSTPAG